MIRILPYNKKAKGVIYNGFRKNNLRFHQITAINPGIKKRLRLMDI